MFFRVLKKDLKRKRTMNVILLLFVILSTLFASMSVNNIISVSNGLDFYFEEAGVPETLVIETGYEPIADRLENIPGVTEIKKEPALVFGAKNINIIDRKLDNARASAMMFSIEDAALNYFDSSNSVIKEVPEGKFYANTIFTKYYTDEKGDKVEFTLGDTKLTLEYAGSVKDAPWGSSMDGEARLIVSEADMQVFRDEPQSSEPKNIQNYYYISGADFEDVHEALKNTRMTYSGSREDLKGGYILEVMIAYIMLAISVLLILIAFVMLRFVIKFTITEEYREIGVMKAIGIDNGAIRRLYIIKYLGIAVIGAAIGCLISMPLNDLMMQSIASNMYLGSGSMNLTSIICAAAVVIVILLFCYFCTRRVNKLSPIDAVRNGQTGERFNRRSFMHLGRSKLPSTGFLAANDVVSAPKQFGLIILIFTLCMIIIALLSGSAETISSEKLMPAFCGTGGDAYVTTMEGMTRILTEDGAVKEINDQIEQALKDNGMPGTCSVNIYGRFETEHNGKTGDPLYILDMFNDTDIYIYDEGYAPRSNDEIAVTKKMLELYDAKLGDKLRVTVGGKEKELMITGTFSSFMNGGKCARLYRDFPLTHEDIHGWIGFEIKFDGDPDYDTIESNVKKLRDILDTDYVFSGRELVSATTGVGDILKTIKLVMTGLMIIISALITVMIEKSFITKDKSEIALMKALGIKNSSIISQHVLRFFITSVIVCGIALALAMPLCNLFVPFIFSMIGSFNNVEVVINVFEIFALSPVILLAVTALSAFLTAITTRSIKAADTAGIE